MELVCSIDQSKFKKLLENPAEREQEDLWWIEPDGSNPEEVVENVAGSFLANGMEWLRKKTKPKNAFAEIEKEHDCLQKYHKAKYLAKHLKDYTKVEAYDRLLQQKQKGLFHERFPRERPILTDMEVEMRREKCPCCGYPTLNTKADFEICLLCDWEDDGQNDLHAKEVWGGPNGDSSLEEARDNFRKT